MEPYIMRTSFARAAAGAILSLSLAGLAGSCAAQTTQSTPQGAAKAAPSATAMPEAGPVNFYQELGGKAGVAAIVADFVQIMLDDKRVSATFEGVDFDRLRTRLAEHICLVSGGGCKYTGRSMAEAHEDVGSTNMQFNASVENLQLAMEKHGIPNRIQNRLLARLAPTQHEIVTK
jgi:hemoglobin